MKKNVSEAVKKLNEDISLIDWFISLITKTKK